MAKAGFCQICNNSCDYRSKICRSCSNYKRYNPNFSIPEDKKKKYVLAVEFIYCRCGCQKTKPKYNKFGIATPFISGHHLVKKPKIAKRIRKDGYTLIYLPNHPNCDCLGYVLEHRYIMEQYIGRYLTKEEIVHHRDRNPKNNDILNLQLMLWGEHSSYHRNSS